MPFFELVNEIHLELVIKLTISIIVGAFLGLERESIQQKQKLNEFGGIRSFTFISLLGFLAALISESSKNYLIAALILSSVTILIAIHYLSEIKAKKFHSITAELAGLITFVIGFICFIQPATAIIIAILTTFILSEKESLHDFAKNIRDEEFAATLKFALLSFLVLPLLPNTTIDPLGVLNPYKVWLLIIFILGISFVGYILNRLVGENKGTVLTAILGGLSSSTAVTQSMADKSLQKNKSYQILAVATILASAIMFIRIFIVVFTLNRELIKYLAIPLGAMFLATIILALLNWYFLKNSKEQIPNDKKESINESPFKMIPALKFGLFFIAVLFITELAKNYLGAKGIYLAAIVSGIVDVDVFTLSMIRISKADPLFTIQAAKAISLVCVSNMFFKACIAYLFGFKKFSRIVILSFTAIILVGLILTLVI